MRVVAAPLLSRIGHNREFPSVEETAEARSDLRSSAPAMESLHDRDRQLVGLRVAAGLASPRWGR